MFIVITEQRVDNIKREKNRNTTFILSLIVDLIIVRDEPTSNRRIIHFVVVICVRIYYLIYKHLPSYRYIRSVYPLTRRLSFSPLSVSPAKNSEKLIISKWAISEEHDCVFLALWIKFYFCQSYYVFMSVPTCSGKKSKNVFSRKIYTDEM